VVIANFAAVLSRTSIHRSEAMEVAREIFERIDTSRNGAIERSEMGRLLEELGVEPTNQNIVSAFLQMDGSEDGLISWEEFYDYYKKNYMV
jgi:Ca2+-binding EF-hand superfamily protein